VSHRGRALKRRSLRRRRRQALKERRRRRRFCLMEARPWLIWKISGKCFKTLTKRR